MSVEITIGHEAFDDWEYLLTLLHAAFEFQNARIDPPSSLHKLNAQALKQKSNSEKLFLAWQDESLVGCVFAREQPDSIYIGKLAVWPQQQGQGIGKSLMQAVEGFAKSREIEQLELQVRIELIENQQAFAAMGFVEVQRTAHLGYAMPTSVTMRKNIK